MQIFRNKTCAKVLNFFTPLVPANKGFLLLKRFNIVMAEAAQDIT